MYIEQIYTSCLSEASYYIESDNKAAIIDPIRDYSIYIQKAKERNATIEYIFETHFHADFVSGHIDLAKATGAPIIYGPNANPAFEATIVSDGAILNLGKAHIKVLHTPGHTLESTCYLLVDENNKENAVFTGDTLFIGDVGRPDLFSGNLSKEDLAAMLYNSLQTKIMTLPDDVIVYPAHGAGSACGKNLSKELQSTIGQQKQTNYALNCSNEADFVDQVTTDLNTPPVYFPINAAINKNGYISLDQIEKTSKALSAADFKKLVDEKIFILDTRNASTFTQGFVPTSIFIGLEGRFAEWAGQIIPYKTPIALVTENGKEQETITRLARVGFENIIGYLEGGFEAWQTAQLPIDMIIDIDAAELRMDMQYDENIAIIDVRNEKEFDTAHIDIADNFPLNTLEQTYTELPEKTQLYLHCAGGYRSVIAASILKKKGIHQLRNILGGWGAISKVEDMPIAFASKVPASLN